MIIDRPRGVVPRAKGCGLGPEYAEVAENVRLLEGRFEPWRQPVRLLEFGERILNAHVRDCCWTGTAVPDARYVDAGIPLKTYLSGPTERPVVTDDICDSNWSNLGYPVPGDPVAIVDSAPEKGPDAQLRSYRITYGTDCEEGAPSCPSNRVIADKTTSVRLQLPPRPDPAWGVTHIRIYRLETLWDSEAGLLDFNPNEIDGGWHSSATESEWFLVGEISIENSAWRDDTHTEVGGMLITEELLPPPEGLVIAGETESGSLVGYMECQLLFSERRKYWGFPVKSAHTFPEEIVDVMVCRDTVYVITKAGAYLVDDAVDCQTAAARPVRAVKGAPAGFCRSRGKALDGGALYSSPEGLVLLRPDGSYTIASRLAFGKDDWSALGPSCIQLETGCDHLFVSVPGGLTYVWILAFDESGYLPEDITTLSFTPQQWITDDRDGLYMLSEDMIYEFGKGDFLQMRWRQIPQRSTHREIVSAIRGEYVKKKTVDFNTLSVYKEGSLSAVRKLTEKGSRIRGSAATCTQLELKGSEPMCWIGAGSGLNDIERRVS